MKMFAEILRTDGGFESILVDGILTGDCDISEPSDIDDKIGEIIGIAKEYELSFRIYRTFAGLRPICVSHILRPLAPIAQRILADIGSDPKYINAMVQNKTFSCRSTPKPERVGMDGGIKFYSMLPKEQEEWVQKYNDLIKGFKTCDFVLQTSECEIPSQIQNFIRLHDEKTGCHLNLPMA